MTFEPTHGMTNSPEYATWNRMKSRCNSSSNYIKRGIKVCPEWINSFEQFYADMGNKPSPNHSLDRINNDGNYEPGNCRWATRKEQNENRTITRKYTIDGITQTLAEWGKEYNLPYHTLLQRVMRGWDIDRALNTPIVADWVTQTHTIDGNTKTIKEWLVEYNIKRTHLTDRLQLGWDIDRALTTPVRKRPPRKVA